VQREHGAALAAHGNLLAGAADAVDGTGRVEEGLHRDPEVVLLGHDVTPDLSLRKG
jgi:hypothetical protein